MIETLSQPTRELELSRAARAIKRSALQELLVRASRPDVLSFALGLPAAELFPTEAYSLAVQHVLATDAKALQYGPSLQPLKSHIVSLMARRGVRCNENEVFITTGAQQAINLLTRLLLDSGGQVMAEEVTYPAFHQIIATHEPELLTVPTDPSTGIDVEAVEFLLANGARPALIYTMSEGHNPLGLSMSREKREHLVRLASEYGVPIVEDDAYGFLNYDGEPLPALKALDEEIVLYIGSFSKILAPALRVGWIVCPEPLVQKLAALKEATDIDCATLAQRSIVALLDTGFLPDHIEKLRQEYRIRRARILDSLERHLPSEARWTVPSSGLFVWVELPENCDTTELFVRAIEMERVAFVPGKAFCTQNNDWASHCLRLNFSNCTPALIEDGISRLGRVISE